MEPTYLEACLKDGLTVRWPDSAMPIKVYVAPFRWYEKSKQRESYAYNQMVYDAFDTWQKLSGELVRFQQVATQAASQIDVSWRRVDRTSLGHCQYLINPQGLLYSAEIKIGISDGLVHAQYNDMDEVRHTILHEVGHAIGLVGHSDGGSDIMYVPHQYGVTQLSQRDADTLVALYQLPPVFDFVAMGRKFKLPEPFTLQNVLDHIEGRQPDVSNARQIDFLPPPLPQQPEVLMQHHDILSQMGKFHLATQNVQINQDVKRLYIQKQRKLPGPNE